MNTKGSAGALATPADQSGRTRKEAFKSRPVAQSAAAAPCGVGLWSGHNILAVRPSVYINNISNVTDLRYFVFLH